VRRLRLAPTVARIAIAIAGVMTVALAACGSSTAKVSGPPPRSDLARLELVGGSDEAKAALAPQTPTNYVLDGPLADLGLEAPVRTLVGHDVSEADVARIAAVFGLHAAPARTDWGYEVRDGDARLTVDTGGAVPWIDYSAAGNASAGSGSSAPSSGGVDVPPDTPDASDPLEPLDPAEPPDPQKPVPPIEEPVPVPTIPPPVDVPDASDATAIARALLDDLGVLDGEQWAHDVSDTSTDVVVSCAADEPCPAPEPGPVTARTVTFDPVIDGTRVLNAGWSVTVGSHRKVEALSGTWARPELSGSYPLRSTRLVFEDVQEGRAQFVGVQALAGDAAAAAERNADDDSADNTEPDLPAPPDTHISGVALGLARWDGTEDGRAVVYVVPTYRFHARAGDATFDVEVLALDPAGFTIAAPSTGAIEPRPAPAPAPDVGAADSAG
jgi:hypothetical protein